MEIKTYAPVVIPTLCRYDTFVRCVDSLSKCTGADQTELFIGIDYPTKESHWEGYRKICAYSENIQGFKAVHIFKREENYGPAKNARTIIEIIKEKYDRYIFSEDDNEFSPNFLEYMNKGLEKYKANPNVNSICGYNYPFTFMQNIQGYAMNAYPMQYYSAWGVGQWFDKKPSHFVNRTKANEVVHSWKAVIKLWKAGHFVTVRRLMIRYCRNTSVSDVMYRVYCVFENKYCIFPAVSKVRNLGNEGNGTICDMVDHRYAKQTIDTNTTFDYDEFEIKQYKPIKKACRKLSSFYKKNFYMVPFCVLEYAWFKVFDKNIQVWPIVKTYRHLLKRD